MINDQWSLSFMVVITQWVSSPSECPSASLSSDDSHASNHRVILITLDTQWPWESSPNAIHHPVSHGHDVRVHVPRCSSLGVCVRLWQSMFVCMTLWHSVILSDLLWFSVISCDHVSINDGCQSESFSDRTPSTMILTSWQVMSSGGLPVAVLSNVTWCGCVSVSVSVSLRMRVREESQWISGES